MATSDQPSSTTHTQSPCAASAALAIANNPAPPHLLFVPGRIEFLGKHTDYAGGRSLLCAVERGFTFAFQPRTDSQIRIFHPASYTRAEFRFDADVTASAATISHDPRLITLSRSTRLEPISPQHANAASPPSAAAPGHWANYAITVARRIARNFAGPLLGIDLAFDSDLPPAAGLSSSSALVIGVFLALARTSALEQRPQYQAALRTREDLAGYLGCVENGQSFENNGHILAGDLGVGTLGGSQDHTAILCARPGELVQYSFFPVRYEAAVPLPEGHTFVIATSGIEAEKSGSAQAAYNRNPLIVRELVELWNHSTGRSDPCLAAAMRTRSDSPEHLRQIIQSATTPFAAATLLDRLNQFIEESERIIPAAARALQIGDLKSLGELVDQSMQAAQKGLQNQLSQTLFLAKSARQIGAAAASAFGAGFGGSVWALVPAADADAFQIEWQNQYRQAFPIESQRAVTFASRAGSSAAFI